MLDVVAARYEGDFRVRVRFSDGMEGSVDLRSSLVGPVFEALRNPARFASFRLNLGTIEWDGGADFAPEYLEELAREAGSLRLAEGEAPEKEREATAAGEVSRFLGIVVTMELEPDGRAIARARYGKDESALDFWTGEISGSLRGPGLEFVREWLDANLLALREDARRLEAGGTLLPIAPLE